MLMAHFDAPITKPILGARLPRAPPTARPGPRGSREAESRRTNTPPKNVAERHAGGHDWSAAREGPAGRKYDHLYTDPGAGRVTSGPRCKLAHSLRRVLGFRADHKIRHARIAPTTYVAPVQKSGVPRHTGRSTLAGQKLQGLDGKKGQHAPGTSFEGPTFQEIYIALCSLYTRLRLNSGAAYCLKRSMLAGGRLHGRTDCDEDLHALSIQPAIDCSGRQTPPRTQNSQTRLWAEQ